MTTETQIPEYLQNEYVIQEGEHLACLDSLLSWYWTNYSFLKENLHCAETVFIENIIDGTGGEFWMWCACAQENIFGATVRSSI